MKRQVVKPYHLFNHHGKWCLINIEESKAYPIDDVNVRFFKNLGIHKDGFPNPESIKLLKEMCLFAGTEDVNKNRSKHLVRKNPVPVVNISLFLTQTCNFNCIYCYGKRGEYGMRSHMDRKTAFQAIDWLIENSRQFKKIQIGFFGGEPFLNFSLLKKVVEYAEEKVRIAKKGVVFYVNTNGSLLDMETIAFAKEHKIKVKVSFDGPKAVQDAQRPLSNGRGSHDIVIPNIKKLLKILPESDVHAVLFPPINPKLVKDYLLKIGFSEISMLPASASFFSGTQMKRLKHRVTKDMFRLMDEEVTSIIGNIKSRDPIGLRKCLSHSQLFAPLKMLLHNLKCYFPCGAGLGYVAISCSGDVYPCHRFVGMDQYRIGSIFNNNLKRDRHLKSPVISYKSCTACFARYYCVGGCKYDNATLNGSVSIPSEDICRWRQRQFELAAYIIVNIDQKDRDFLSSNNIILPKPCPLDF